jgi:DNA-binding response OmpR family regulator
MVATHQSASLVVLLVDDDPHVRWYMERALVEDGYRVLTADDGRSALEVAHTVHVDAVVSDVRMPGLDGYGLVARLREWSSPPPVLLVSGFSSEEPTCPYLRKPFTPDALAAAVRDLLGASGPQARHE